MIVLHITNASDVVASKVGRFLERLTPEAFDIAKVEDIVLHRLVENLAAEGITGQIAAVSGMELQGRELVLQTKVHVRRHQEF
jgi:hypothetical protein